MAPPTTPRADSFDITAQMQDYIDQVSAPDLHKPNLDGYLVWIRTDFASRGFSEAFWVIIQENSKLSSNPNRWGKSAPDMGFVVFPDLKAHGMSDAAIIDQWYDLLTQQMSSLQKCIFAPEINRIITLTANSCAVNTTSLPPAPKNLNFVIAMADLEGSDGTVIARHAGGIEFVQVRFDAATFANLKIYAGTQSDKVEVRFFVPCHSLQTPILLQRHTLVPDSFYGMRESPDVIGLATQENTVQIVSMGMTQPPPTKTDFFLQFGWTMVAALGVGAGMYNTSSAQAFQNANTPVRFPTQDVSHYVTAPVKPIIASTNTKSKTPTLWTQTPIDVDAAPPPVKPSTTGPLRLPIPSTSNSGGSGVMNPTPTGGTRSTSGGLETASATRSTVVVTPTMTPLARPTPATSDNSSTKTDTVGSVIYRFGTAAPTRPSPQTAAEHAPPPPIPLSHVPQNEIVILPSADATEFFDAPGISAEIMVDPKLHSEDDVIDAPAADVVDGVVGDVPSHSEAMQTGSWNLWWIQIEQRARSIFSLGEKTWTEKDFDTLLREGEGSDQQSLDQAFLSLLENNNFSERDFARVLQDPMTHDAALNLFARHLERLLSRTDFFRLLLDPTFNLSRAWLVSAYQTHRANGTLQEMWLSDTCKVQLALLCLDQGNFELAFTLRHSFHYSSTSRDQFDAACIEILQNHSSEKHNDLLMRTQLVNIHLPDHLKVELARLYLEQGRIREAYSLAHQNLETDFLNILQSSYPVKQTLQGEIYRIATSEPHSQFGLYILNLLEMALLNLVAPHPLYSDDARVVSFFRTRNVPQELQEKIKEKYPSKINSLVDAQESKYGYRYGKNVFSEQVNAARQNGTLKPIDLLFDAAIMVGVKGRSVFDSRDSGLIGAMDGYLRRNNSGYIGDVLELLDAQSQNQATIICAIMPLANRADIISTYRDLLLELAYLRSSKNHTISSLASLLTNSGHGQPAPQQIDTIERLLAAIKTHAPDDPLQVIPFLEQALVLAKEIYRGDANNFDSIPNLDKITLPLPQSHPPTLTELQELALSLRRLWPTANGEQREVLLRMQRALFGYAYGHLTYTQSDSEVVKIQKMATLIDVLYGAGFGEKEDLRLAETLHVFASTWETDADTKYFRLAQYAKAALQFTERCRDKYQKVWGDYFAANPIQTHYIIGYDPEKQGNREFFVQNYPVDLFRSGPGIVLSNYAEALQDAWQGSPEVAALLQTQGAFRPTEAPMTPVFFDDPTYSENRLLHGNKGIGLHQSAMDYPNLVPRGFTIPPRTPEHKLTADEKQHIDLAIARIETEFGPLGEGLILMVRSGGAVSAPGLMETVAVHDRAELYAAIEQIYASSNHPAYTEYRHRNGIPDGWGTPVNIQVQVNALTGGSGVVQSLADGSLKVDYNQAMMGSAVVSEGIARDKLPDALYTQLAALVAEQERKMQMPMEFEFAVTTNAASGESQIWLLQKRAAPMSYEEKISWYAQKVKSGQIDQKTAIRLLGGATQLKSFLQIRRVKNKDVVILAQNPAPEHYRGHGPVTVQIKLKDDRTIYRSIVVITNPDAKDSAAEALSQKAVITNMNLPMGSHLAAILRSNAISAVVGLNFRIEDSALVFVNPDDREVTMSHGDWITIDPLTQTVYAGKAEFETTRSPNASDIEYLLSQ